METITLRLDEHFLKEIDEAAKQEHYQSRTEFIRQALREKLKQVEFERIKAHIESIRGSWKGPPMTEEEYERNRQGAFDEISQELDKSSGL